MSTPINYRQKLRTSGPGNKQAPEDNRQKPGSTSSRPEAVRPEKRVQEVTRSRTGSIADRPEEARSDVTVAEVAIPELGIQVPEVSEDWDSMPPVELAKFRGDGSQRASTWWLFFIQWAKVVAFANERLIASFPFHLVSHASTWYELLSEDVKTNLEL